MPAALPTVTVQNGNGASVALPEVFTSPIRPYVYRLFTSRRRPRSRFTTTGRFFFLHLGVGFFLRERFGISNGAREGARATVLEALERSNRAV